MKTDQEHFLQNARGSGLVYVLIAVALFAALSFTLMRSTDTGEAGTMSDDKAELYATQIISYAGQAKNVIEQMKFSGSDADELDFSRPGEAGYTAGTQADRVHHVFHPEGGGLNYTPLPGDAILQINSDPVPGWYMGRFNNVEWTPTTAQDVILVAHQIKKEICEKINEKITGNTTIPVWATESPEFLIDEDAPHGYGNSNFSIAVCNACEGYDSLCIVDVTGSYSFYNLMVSR